MNTVKRWLAGFLSFAMIFTSAAFSNVGALNVFAASHSHDDAKLADSQVVATITDDAGLSSETTYRYEGLDKALGNAEAGDVIKLQKDITIPADATSGFSYSETLDASKEETVTLDLNGHNIISKADVTILNGGVPANRVGFIIKGSGNIETATGATKAVIANATITGAANANPSVVGTLSNVDVEWGIYTANIYKHVKTGHGIFVRRTSNGTPVYEVGKVEANWDWAADGSKVNFNVVIEGTNDKLLADSIPLNPNPTVGVASATCVETGYKYHSAKVTLVDSIDADHYIAGTDDGSGTYTDKNGASSQRFDWANGSIIKGLASTDFETKSKTDRFIVEDDIEAVKGHDYEAIPPLFEEINGVAIEDEEENPVYTTILTCKRNTCEPTFKGHELTVEGAISLTKGETVSYTTDNGTYQTKTTEVKMYKDSGTTKGKWDSDDKEIDCKTSGDFYLLTFDILDADDNTLVKDVKIAYWTPIAWGTHNYSYVQNSGYAYADLWQNNNNVKTFWVYEKNGKEIEVDASKWDAGSAKFLEITDADPQGADLIEYAKSHDNKLKARTYAYCTGTNCDSRTMVDEQTIEAATATPAAVKANTDGNTTYYAVTDGMYVFNSSFGFDYTNTDNNTSGTYTLENVLEKVATGITSPASTRPQLNMDPSLAKIMDSFNPSNIPTLRGSSYTPGPLFAEGTFDITDSNFATKNVILKADEFNEGIIELKFKSGFDAFIDLDRDGVKDSNETALTLNTFYQVIPATATEHTWTKVDKVTNAVTATDANGKTHTFDDEHFEGLQATETHDGYDGFDLYYCAYKAQGTTPAYQYAFVYGDKAPSGEPDATTGSLTIPSGGSIDFSKTSSDSTNRTINNIPIYGKNAAEGNLHPAKRWVYVVDETDKANIAGLNGLVGAGNILAVNYKAQYEADGGLKDVNYTAATALSSKVTVFYGLKEVPNATTGSSASETYNGLGRNSNYGVAPTVSSLGTTMTSIILNTKDANKTSAAYLAPYSLVAGSADTTDCDKFVTYTALNESVPLNFANDTYDFVTAEPGDLHAAITGTVTWKTEGSATVKLVCDKCKETVPNDTPNNLKIKRTKVVEPTCLEDGYTEYKASYRGFFEGVTLKNDEFKGSPVAAVGHEISKTSLLKVTKDGDAYKGQVYCTKCEEYHDDVTSIEGPTVENDKSRTIKVNYTDGLAEYDAKGVKNTNFTKESQTLTLIDGVDPELNITGAGGEYTAVYGELSDYEIYNAFDFIELENGDLLGKDYIYDKSENELYAAGSVTFDQDHPLYNKAPGAPASTDPFAAPVSVTVTDAEGNVVTAPTRKANAKKLAVGTYTVTITGEQTGITSAADNSTFNYTGSIVKTVEVIDSVYDYTVYDQVDGKENYDTTVTYDGKAHTYKAVAYVKDHEEYQDVDKDVTFSYTLDGKEVTEDALTFTDAGKYQITVTAKKANFKDYTRSFNFEVEKAYVTAAIDNATMVEGNAPQIRYTLTSEDVKTIDEKAMGFKIVSTGGDDLTKLIPGTYTLKGTATNENYTVSTVGYASGASAPTLTVVANDGSTQEEQALASAAAKKINDLTDESSAADVAAARKAYDALSAKAKARIDSATLAKLTAQEDRVAAAAVINQLNNAKTDAEKAAAYNAYNKLSAAAKAKVDANAAAKAKLAEAKTAADKAAANSVVSQLGSVKTSMTEAAAKKIVAAYNALTADQKALVNANATAKANLAKAQKIAKRTAATYKLSKKTYKIKRGKKASIKTSGKGGTKTFKKVGKGSKLITVSKKGKITVKKSAKKGKTYTIKVKITSPQTDNYKKFNKTFSVKVKVK